MGPGGIPVMGFLSVHDQIQKALSQSAANQSANIETAAIKDDHENVQPTAVGITAAITKDHDADQSTTIRITTMGTEDHDNDDEPKLYGIAVVQQEEDSSYDFQTTSIKVSTEKYDSTPSSIVYFDEYDTGPKPWPWMVSFFARTFYQNNSLFKKFYKKNISI